MQKANALELYMLGLINAHRDDLGLPALRLERHLNQSAQDHSEWMLRTDTFSHTGAGRSSEIDRMQDAGFDFKGDWRATENIAIQVERGAAGMKNDVRDLHQEFMDSPSHYANLINPDMEYIGINITLGGYNYGTGDIQSVAVTQNFASTTGSVTLDPGNSTIKYGTTGHDTLKGNARKDSFDGYAGNDSISGGKGGDQLRGGNGADKINGQGGGDQLWGNNGKDKLWGVDGADTLNGGAGWDKLWGGKGADTFIYKKGNDTDVIADFENNKDTLDLSALNLDSRAEAVRYAEQKGDKVVFDFGGDNILKVEDITISQLRDDLAI